MTVDEKKVTTGEALPDKLAQKARKKRRKRWIVAGVALLVVVLAVGGILRLRSRVAQEYGSMMSESDIVSAPVSTGNISTTVSGSGILADEEVEALTLPASLEIKEVYVAAGDYVQQGDRLAAVSPETVLTAMAETQKTLDDFDARLRTAARDAAPAAVNAGVGGRVKAVYAAVDDDVTDVMAANGALALLSLDGLMAADIAGADAPAVGSAVTVTLPDGSQEPGTVESVSPEGFTVTLSDRTAPLGGEVTVTDGDGSALGSGTLYIHKELRVTGFAGTVSAVQARENAQVWNGSQLFSLRDTAYAANYNAILVKRAEAEETLAQLIGIYREGVVTAPFTGLVSGGVYDPDAAQDASGTGDADDAGDLMGLGGEAAAAAAASAASASAPAGELTLLKLTPNRLASLTVSVDESQILVLAPGQEAAITLDSLPGESFPGTVTKVNKSSDSTAGITSYTVTITLEKTDRMLAGMRASAKIHIESVSDALLIPTEALMGTSAGSFVYTSYDPETQTLGGMVEVQTGLDNGSYVVITQGLSQGDEVWYEKAFSIWDMYSTDGNTTGGDAGYDVEFTETVTDGDAAAAPAAVTDTVTVTLG